MDLTIVSSTAVAVTVAVFAGRWFRLPGPVLRRLSGQRGEGVISTAIAVLIMALVGLAMWQLFDRVFTDAGTQIEDNVNDIGG